MCNAGLLATRLGSEFVPRLREQAIVINTVRLAGVSLDESVRYGTQIERTCSREFPDEIEHIWTRTGTAEVATDPMGLEVSDVFCDAEPREQWTRASTQDELMERDEQELEGMPGMRSIFTQPIEMRINEMIAGIRADVGVKLFGDDFEVLREGRARSGSVVEQIPGASDVTTRAAHRAAGARAWRSIGRPWRATGSRRRGARGSSSRSARPVGEVIEGQRRFDLGLRLEDRYRDNPASSSACCHGAWRGAHPARPAGHIERRGEPVHHHARVGAAAHHRCRRTCAERDIGSFVADGARGHRRVELPPGYYVRFGGQFEHLERARERLMIVVPWRCC